MQRWQWLAGVGTVAVLLALSDSAWADRVPSTRTAGQSNFGTRQDITVPYLTTGRSAFGAYSVAPRIYASPTVDDPKNPQAKPVFNLIFYGSVQSFGDKSNGATPKPR
jgi:hypothetical protein